jgi:hypothetical protein
MEPNNNKKRLVSFLIVLGVVLLAIMSWMIFKRSKPQVLTPAQQVTKDANSIFSVSKLTFPKILGLTPLLKKDIPANIQFFSLNGSTDQTYKTIQYENSKTGFNFSYIVPSFTIEKFVAELPKQIALSKVKSPWVMQSNTRTDAIGYMDFTNSTSTVQARVTFIQQGSNVKVAVQTLN